MKFIKEDAINLAIKERDWDYLASVVHGCDTVGCGGEALEEIHRRLCLHAGHAYEDNDTGVFI